VLVLAHGGSFRWNRTVRQTVHDARLRQPTELVFGMGMHPHEVAKMQRALERLRRHGIQRLVVVPLLVSSHSEIFEQFKFLFGLRPQAIWPEAGGPLQVGVPVELRPALDESPQLREVLLDRARALSRNALRETVILVAHGPNDEAANQRWVAMLNAASQYLKQAGGFREAVGVTLRDDAPEPTRRAAIEQLRQEVQRVSADGEVLVVPVLMAKGGIERKIAKALKGLTYRYSGQTLLPHPLIAQWIAQRAAEAPDEAVNPAPRKPSSSAPAVRERVGSDRGAG